METHHPASFRIETVRSGTPSSEFPGTELSMQQRRRSRQRFLSLGSDSRNRAGETGTCYPSSLEQQKYQRNNVEVSKKTKKLLSLGSDSDWLASPSGLGSSPCLGDTRTRPTRRSNSASVSAPPRSVQHSAQEHWAEYRPCGSSILADHVQNLVLERDDVGDGWHPPWALLMTNANRDTTYKWSV